MRKNGSLPVVAIRPAEDNRDEASNESDGNDKTVKHP
jgi:hypothetical protein